jgi:hypothetical protein
VGDALEKPRVTVEERWKYSKEGYSVLQ